MARAHAAHTKAVFNRRNHPVAIESAKHAVRCMQQAKTFLNTIPTKNASVHLLKKEFPPSLYKHLK